MVAQATVRGGAETAKAFDALARDVADMRATHEAVMRARLPGVIRRTPRDTGRLADSWQVTARADAGSITSSERHAAPIEYGVPDRGIEPARMVRGTLEDEQSAIVAEYESALRARAKARGFRVE